jgi:hypothetical protein
MRPRTRLALALTTAALLAGSAGAASASTVPGSLGSTVTSGTAVVTVTPACGYFVGGSGGNYIVAKSLKLSTRSGRMIVTLNATGATLKTWMNPDTGYGSVFAGPARGWPDGLTTADVTVTAHSIKCVPIPAEF